MTKKGSKNIISYFDTHQDISDAVLYSSHADFLRKGKIGEGYNDLGLPVGNQTDYYRLKNSGGKVVFAVSCAVGFDKDGHVVNHPDHFGEILRHIDLYHDIVHRAKGRVSFIRNKNDLKKWNEEGKIKFLLSIEGADSITSEEKLRKLYDLGVRNIILTYNEKNRLAGGANTKVGLSKVGEKIIGLMEEMGILLDLSHIGKKSFYDIMKLAKKPVIVSHTACKALTNHPRNMTDDQINLIAKKGGMIGIGGIPRFVGGHEIDDMVRHYLHVIDLVGIDHVILGSDLGSIMERPLINKFEDVTGIPRLFSKLREAGISGLDIEKIARRNILKLLRETLK